MFGNKYFVHLFVLVQIANLTWAQKKSMEDVKVVVIGAGPAGLHSAYKLTEAGVNNVVVLEANDRLGGRINSFAINGNWIECGAQWIHGEGENPLWKFVQEQGIAVNDDTAEGGGGVYLRDDGQIIPKEIKDETDEAIKSFRESCSTDPADKPDSVGDYLTRSFRTWLAKSKPNDDAATTAWRKQLFKWTMKLENFDSAADNLFNQSSISWCGYNQIEPDRSFLDGYQSLINYWKDALATKIQTNKKVTKILWQNSDGTVTVQTGDGETFQADHVIITVSLGYLKQHQSGLFVPQLPKEKVNVIKTLKFGTTDKIFLEFEEDFWDETGIQFLWSGDELDSTQFDEKNWIHNLIGFDVVQNQPKMLVGWMAGVAAKYMETLSDEEIKKEVLNQLTHFMQKRKNDPTYQLPALKLIKVTRWHTDPLFLGSYSYRETDSDLLGITHDNLAEPLSVDNVPRVLFAGEATTSDYYSAVHGAMFSAQREAERIIANLSTE